MDVTRELFSLTPREGKERKRAWPPVGDNDVIKYIRTNIYRERASERERDFNPFSIDL